MSSQRPRLILAVICLILSLATAPLAFATPGGNTSTATEDQNEREHSSLWEAVRDLLLAVLTPDGESSQQQGSEEPSGDTEYGPGLDPFG